MPQNQIGEKRPPRLPWAVRKLPEFDDTVVLEDACIFIDNEKIWCGDLTDNRLKWLREQEWEDSFVYVTNHEGRPYLYVNSNDNVERRLTLFKDGGTFKLDWDYRDSYRELDDLRKLFENQS